MDMKRAHIWLLLTLLSVITVLFGTIYAVGQQTLRQSANDPQISQAEDIAAQLGTGAAPTGLVQGSVNIASSLSPFVIIYDVYGRPVAGSGYLDGKLPVIPKGVLTAAKNRHYHAVTWQPSANVRIAAVSVAANSYYVVGGRSLQEIEVRERLVLELAVLGWMLANGLILAGAIGYQWWPIGKRR